MNWDREMWDRYRKAVHDKGFKTATPFRMGIAVGESGNDEENPYWWSDKARKNFDDGVLVGKRLKAGLSAYPVADAGWDSRHYTYHCSDGEHSSFWRTVTESPQWIAWEDEQARRFAAHCAANSDVFDGCFDVDECRECGWLGEAHWQAFCEWLATRVDKPTPGCKL